MALHVLGGAREFLGPLSPQDRKDLAQAMATLYQRRAGPDPGHWAKMELAAFFHTTYPLAHPPVAAVACLGQSMGLESFQKTSPRDSVCLRERRLLLEELHPNLRGRLLRHVQRCPSCYQKRTALGRDLGAIKRSLPAMELSFRDLKDLSRRLDGPGGILQKVGQALGQLLNL